MTFTPRTADSMQGDERTTIDGVPSLVAPSTLVAYAETAYHVGLERSLTLHVGVRSPGLLELQARHRVSCSAFVTACNPLGRLVDARTNARRRSRLDEELSRAGVPFVDGLGQHPSSDWPGEESVLAFGLELAVACALGRRHRQNALLWSGADATPRLVLLR